MIFELQCLEDHSWLNPINVNGDNKYMFNFNIVTEIHDRIYIWQNIIDCLEYFDATKH